MTNLIKLAAFLFFLILGALAARRGNRRSVNGLLLYLVVLSLAVSITNREAWPFATYPLVPSRYSEEMEARKLQYTGVAESGREYEVNPETFSPMYPLALDIWFEKTYAGLDQRQRAEAMRFLAQRAEEQRRRMSEGKRIGSRRILGPLAAPDWWLYPNPSVSAEPFISLRVYRIVWHPGERYRNAAAFRRTLLAEAAR